MQTDLLRIILRFIFLVMLQVFVLKNIEIPQFNYLHLFAYPIFLFLLPLKISRHWMIVISFFTGLTVDIFYSSIGVHASAATFSGFMRYYIFKVFEPRGGYAVNVSPTMHHLGTRWFLQYSAVIYIFFLLFYFSVEAFSFVYWKSILLKTAFSFVFSYFIIVIYSFLFNPK